MTLDNQEELIEYDAWAIPLRTGSIWALIAIIISLGIYLTIGIDASGGFNASTIISMLAGIILAVIMPYMAMKNHRDQNLNGYISFGTCIKVGLRVILVYTLLLIIYNFVFTTFIEPDLATDAFQLEIEKLEDSGAPESQIEMTEKMFSIFTNPLVMALMTFVWSFGMGLICSLLSAAMAKKERPGLA